MDDSALVLLFLVAFWALVYAFVIERRRRRDNDAADEKFNALHRQLDLLDRSLKNLSATAPAPAESAAPLAQLHVPQVHTPQVHILQEPPPPPPPKPAAAHVTPAYAPLVVPKPAPPATVEKPVAPIIPPAPVRALCKRCARQLAPEAEFCTFCGARVAAAGVSPEPPQASATLPPKPAAAPAAPGSSQPPVASPSIPVAPFAPPPPLPPKAFPSGGPLFSSAAPAPGPSPSPSPKKRTRSLEEIVGTNWLPKIGVVILVIGIALLTARQWRYVTSWWALIGSWGRSIVVLASGLGLLVSGIRFEQKARYKTLGRAMIGGGWAVVFLLAYAIRHSPTFQILPSDWADLAVLLVVAGAMVRHTLKYNSQTVTGIAFLLGFTAVALNPDPPFNLLAGAILVAGMTVIVVRRRWFELEIFGIVASYANHFYWLYTVYEQQGQRSIFPNHGASVALMIGYWAIFRASYLVRDISAKPQEAVSTSAGILNPILFLIVMKYQAFHPEWAWWLLLAMGAAEFILGQLPVSRRRRAPFQILSTLGVALMVASPLVKGSGNALEMVWLAGAEAFLVAGILTRERLFRGFGLVISLLVALYAAFFRIIPLAQQIAAGQPHRDGPIALVLAVIAAVLWANAHLTRRFWPDLFKEELEGQSLTVLSFIASLFAVGAVYAYIPAYGVAVALALLVTWLAVTGKLFSIVEMTYEAHWITALAFIQAVAVDASLEGNWLRIPLRGLAFASVAALFYVSSRFVRLSETLGKEVSAAVYCWLATTLLTTLVWYQAAEWAKAVLWIALGLALAFIGQTVKRADLKWQAFALVLLSSAQALVFNLGVTEALSGNPHAILSHVTYRLLSVSLIALGIYLLARWAPREQMRPIYTVLGTLLLTLLAYQEASAPWTGVAWIGLALALSAAALWFKQADLKWQAFVLVLLAFVRTLETNFDLTETFHSITLRLISVSLTALGIYLLARWAPLPQIRPVYSVAGTFLLAYLALKEAPTPWTAVCWAGLALALVLAARWWKDRSLLWQTHLLAALAAGWTLYTNLDPQYHQTRVQLITVSITAAVLYALTWLTNIAEAIGDERICQAYAWAGSLLVSWLAWAQFQPNAVSVAWGIFALLLFEFPELARSLKIAVNESAAASWRMQAYVALAGSFVHIFIANFNPPGWGPAAYDVLPLAAIYFNVYSQLGRREISGLEKSMRVEFLLACLGTATLAALVRFELPGDAVVIGYAGLVVGTLVAAWLAHRQVFLFLSLVMLGVTAFRVSMNNFYHLNERFGSSLGDSIWAIALLAGAVPLALQVRKNAPSAGIPRWFRPLALRPEQPMFFVPVALTAVLLVLKLSGGRITLGWGVEGLVVFILALWAKERSFRLTGLGLVLLAVAKILLWDAWHVDVSLRILAFIAVGLIVLALSYLYGRNREALRDYL